MLYSEKAIPIINTEINYWWVHQSKYDNWREGNGKIV